MRGGATTTLRTLEVCTLSNGHELRLHLHELAGGAPGPTLGILGGVHGDEQLGIEIARQVLLRTDPTALRGRVLAIPVANPYSFQALSRATPIDMQNLNRVFPGGGEGWLTERIAEVVCEQFLPECDYLIDFHSGGDTRTVDYAYLDPDRPELARAFGTELLYRSAGYEGAVSTEARRRGIGAVVSELGGGQQRNDHYVAKAVRGAHNVMRQVGMLDGEPEVPQRQVVVTELVTVRPNQGGLMVTDLTVEDLGRTVPGGTELGRVVSPYTFETLDVLTAPFDPSYIVVVQVSGTMAEAGGYGFMAANAATAEAL